MMPVRQLIQTYNLISRTQFIFTVYNGLQRLPEKKKLGIPIDRVPTSKSCVFCMGMEIPFFQHLKFS